MIRGALLLVAIAMVLCAVFFARPRATPGPPMRDFEAYYAAGTQWNRGADPYGLSIWQGERVLKGVSPQRREILPFVGPPATLPLWSMLARLPFDIANAVWRVALVIAILVLVITVLNLGGVTLRLFSFLAGGTFALGFGPLTSCFALGQMALPAFACAALAVLWPPAGLLAWAQPNVAFALLSQVWHRRSALAVASGAVLFAVGCVLVAGLPGVVRYGTIVHAHARAEQFSAIQITPAAVAFGFGMPERGAALFGLLAAIAAAGVWIVLMRLPGNNAARFCSTCALLPIAMPFFHEHDLVVLFAPAAYFALRCSARTWPAVATGALLCATDWLGLAQRPDGALQTVLLITGAALSLFVLRRDLRAGALLLPASVPVAIGVAALYAQHHAAPVWPDAMAALRLARGSDIASVWHAEQYATGLLHPQPFWALLRCGSLLGCAILSSAALVSSKLPLRSKNPLPAPV